MRHEGKLTQWNDDKGFGFITPAAGGPRVFVHISAFPRDGRRPTLNEPVTYHLTQDSQNRPKAQKALYLKAPRHASPRSKGLMLACVIAAAFFALLAALVAAGHMPMQLIAAYALLSVSTFAIYGIDKAAAGKGRRRTPEATLLFVGLIGGWPGALIAQRLFRHKTRKQPFQAVFWCGVVVNCGVVGWLVYTGEAARLWAGLGFGE
ncbi:DUF1294 domain-containing protein [Halomonas sp. MCCC 1A11036]|uniref:DUF1294 domain-containing protein n=1 Tax=Billgrantia zhangzhouensis TaxID=2733481 RepID=A0ABS9ADT8_9GAMM|nr:cold shock and DUF1294 domain-containing protein [Halomonas zhangzhouensis]MCE8019905.1 DUF1294 domain-containing protein [Halomonas zhangzhouensis]